MAAALFILPLMMQVWREWQLHLGILGVGRESILEFPAWDCLPYDRISPGGVLTGKRLHCLAELATHADRPRIVLTTINAWLQRTPPRELFAASTLSLRPGDQISAANLTRFFTANAYHRADTVREAGEYAVRGGIVDVFPPGADEPVRIDFFDTEIETIRHFDPETQRSTGQASALSLNPVSEFILDDETISAFRGRYLEQFGAAASRDPLYVSVSEGRHHPGMEHMLPLFHARLDHLSDFTSDAPVLMAAEVDAAARHRLGQINDFHAARIEAMENAADQDSSSIWRPLPPDALYLDEAGWTGLEQERLIHRLSHLAGRKVRPLQGMMLAAGAVLSIIQRQPMPKLKQKPIRWHRQVLLLPQRYLSLSNRVRLSSPQHLKALAAVFDQLIAEHLPPRINIRPVSRIDDLEPGQVYAAVWPIEDGFVSPGLTVITEKDVYGNRIASHRVKGAAVKTSCVRSHRSKPAILLCMLTMASAAMRGLNVSLSQVFSMIACFIIYSGATSCSCLSRTLICCRVTAKRVAKLSSINLVAHHGRRERHVLRTGA